jgi:hypothetical protein
MSRALQQATAVRQSYDEDIGEVPVEERLSYSIREARPFVWILLIAHGQRNIERFFSSRRRAMRAARADLARRKAEMGAAL